jgi:hypothetical protein
MPNNSTTKDVGQRSAAAGAARTSATPYIPPPRPAPPQPAQATARPAQPRPTARVAQPPAPRVQPPAQAEPQVTQPASTQPAQVSHRQSREFTPPGAGFWHWLVTSGNSKPKGSITATKRAMYLFGGIGLLAFSTWLNFLFMQATFPAMQGSGGGDQKAFIASIAANTVFLMVELFIWESQHSPVVWFICLGIMAVDLTINTGGCLKLFGVKELIIAQWPPDLASVFIIIVGAGAALLPEKLLNAGIRG